MDRIEMSNDTNSHINEILKRFFRFCKTCRTFPNSISLFKKKHFNFFEIYSLKDI